MPRKPAARPAVKVPPKVAPKAAPKVAPKASPKAAPRAPQGAARIARPATKAALKTAVKVAANVLAKPAPKKTVQAVPKARVAAPVERAAVQETRPVLVRDSFTMPEAEYAVLLAVKQACLRAGIDVKKSELLRIGVALLGQLDVATLQGVLAALPQLKTGRPPAA